MRRAVDTVGMRVKKIKIAIAVDASGHWSARGAYNEPIGESIELVLDDVDLGLRRVYLAELEVPVPRPEDLGTVPARVTELDAG